MKNQKEKPFKDPKSKSKNDQRKTVQELFFFFFFLPLARKVKAIYAQSVASIQRSDDSPGRRSRS